ncbi:hypothetical protein FQN52_000420 [Onygenales sp. PD_12]|nr:hypothetical protein FQN52_000420 [Onygenales sp. PD_12]
MAKNVTGLPVELLHDVLSLLDRTSLKQLRSTCRVFMELATAELFRTLQLFPDDEGCQRFKSLLQGNAVQNHVRNIYFNTYGEDWDSDSGLYSDDEDSDVDDPSGDNIKEQMSSLNRFPRLNHVALRFEPHFFFDADDYVSRSPPQNIDFREEILKSFVSNLASSPAQPDSLAIGSLQCAKIKNPKTMAMLKQALQGLRALRLSIANLRIDGDCGYNVSASEMMITKLQSTWLSPTIPSLEHLTLHSDQYFGLHPKLDLSGIHFPRLKSLALGRHAFCHDVQVDWIISHAQTLRELYLDDCPILHSVISWDDRDMKTYHPALRSEKWEIVELEGYLGRFPLYTYHARWHDYFTKFRTGLPLLQHFRIGKITGDREDLLEHEHDITIGLFRDRYMVFAGPDHYRTSDDDGGDVAEKMGEMPSCHDEDKEALCALFEKIGQRLAEEDRINENLVEEY